jgi:hypothetical protein
MTLRLSRLAEVWTAQLLMERAAPARREVCRDFRRMWDLILGFVVITQVQVFS